MMPAHGDRAASILINVRQMPPQPVTFNPLNSVLMSDHLYRSQLIRTLRQSDTASVYPYGMEPQPSNSPLPGA
jgi:hypothetical protein